MSIVRPAIVFGPNNHELLPVFRSIDRLRLHLVPGFTPRRISLIHVDDLVDILLRIAERGKRLHPFQAKSTTPTVEDGWYVAACPETPTYPEFGRLIAEAFGMPSPLVLTFAEPFAWMAAVANQGFEFSRGQSSTFNIDKMREAFAGDWVACADSLNSDLGFRFRTPLRQRLAETIAGYRQAGWL